ncbi:MAG: hypothetical protein Q8L26_04230 [Candidatus Omnitrophota bacterium]|nr:hypothetical protein [Candidatus Omnitrophota bacterium]
MLKPKYYLDNKTGEFVIENYNSAKPFASFFPGIAGFFGIPMWVFYVNRGQLVISFGTKDKNHSILEFLPANQAWQSAASEGFRTFLKVKNGSRVAYYEPFQDSLDNLSFDLRRLMRIKSYELALEEINPLLGLKIDVRYFTLSGEPIAAIIRELKITNTGKKILEIEAVDGLPKITPYGTANFFLKDMSRTIEAWMRVDFLNNKIPFYNLYIDPADRPETFYIEGGNFYLPFCREGNKNKLLDAIVDPVCLFGQGDFSYPRNFINKEKFNPALSKQIKESRTPCAFSYFSSSIKPDEPKSIFSIVGYASGKEKLIPQIERILNNSFIQEKQQENANLIREIEDNIHTESAFGEFNLYAKQTFLDNVLRGGYPVSFSRAGKKSVFYLYSRKHGDLERDYNNFLLSPTYFSQGNGNYRDMNQNRRSDNWFNSDVAESNLVDFLNLIQTDGFNPLVIKGLSFSLEEKNRPELLNHIVDTKDRENLGQFFNKPFTPGSLAMLIEENNIGLDVDMPEFLKEALCLSARIEDAEHSEGFWSDHWAYNLDLIESYLALYPEKLKEIFVDKKIFSFFDNAEIVQPRDVKYVLTGANKVSQHHSLKKDPEKEELIRSRAHDAHRVRADFGKGDIIYVSLLTKLLCLFVNKLASLDAQGIGVEMEANKPNWFDSLNGLPALFGSSTNETFELKRLIIFIKDALKNSRAFQYEDMILPLEINNFLKNLGKLLEEYFASGSKERDFIFWDKAYALKEGYRANSRFGFSGKESGIKLAELFSILNAAERKISFGLSRAVDKKTGIYRAYFINEVVDYELYSGSVRVRKFKQEPLPFFLEAQVHALRLEKDTAKAASLYKAIRSSSLYDRKLKMYKVCAPLKEAPIEIGRCRVFTPGWLENESVWLHMEYKFLLELLRCGLYEEFYNDFFNCFIPFLDAKKYGRSILENSSFLASSAFCDDSLHGNGFVARLSGSTAEFISIWLAMNIGFNLFKLDKEGKLTLEFKPILHKKLFTKKKNYSFKFLNKTLVVYHNPKLRNTFGPKGVSVGMYIFEDDSGELITIKSGIITHPYAEKIRSGLIKKIDVYLV